MGTVCNKIKIEKKIDANNNQIIKTRKNETKKSNEISCISETIAAIEKDLQRIHQLSSEIELVREKLAYTIDQHENHFSEITEKFTNNLTQYETTSTIVSPDDSVELDLKFNLGSSEDTVLTREEKKSQHL